MKFREYIDNGDEHSTARVNTLKRLFERLYPLAIALVITGAVYKMSGRDTVGAVQDIANPMLSIVGILVGFTGTALTILATSTDDERINRFRQLSQFGDLINYHWAMIRDGIIACILTLFVLIICNPAKSQGGNELLKQAGFYAWIFMNTLSLCDFFRVTHLLQKLIHLSRPNCKPGKINLNK